MKLLLPFVAIVLTAAGCTTAYKSGQTPDDVYYSPARPQDEYVRTENRSQPDYRYEEQSEDDRYLRMKVRNRRTWSDLDYYYSDPLAYNYYNRFNTYNSLYYNTPWNYYTSWNYYYNPYNNFYGYSNPYFFSPYGGKVVSVTPRPPVYNRPRTFNLNVYNPPQNTDGGNSNTRKAYGTRRGYGGDNNYNTNNNNNRNNSNRNSDNSSLRNVFGTNNSNTSTQQNTPARSTPSTSPSVSPSRGSTNAPTRKF